MNRQTDQHVVSDECVEEHCYSHDVDEPLLGDDYQLCGECMHVFRDAEELIQADIKWSGSARDPGEIWSCPHCLHDF